MAGRSGEVATPSRFSWVFRATECLLLLAIVTGCLIVLQKSFHFIDTAPFLNVDDSIPNVAVSLAEHGRYGFLSSPTQGFHEVDRTHAFFNYGPLYFYVAAALTWLIGPSLELYRMLHPAGLVFVVLASLWVFRRVSVVGTAILAVAVLRVYLASEWPLARPDIMVSVCVSLMLVFAARAIQHGAWLDWLGVGFFAASALTTHQIAASMVPVAGIIWAWSAVVEWRQTEAGPRRRWIPGFVALVLGGAAGALVYLVAIDFRLRDLWVLGSVSMSSYSKPYAETLRAFFEYAWSWNSGSHLWLWLWFATAAIVAITGSFLTGELRRRVLGLVMPPVVTAVVYQLSLGFYGNQHSGYVILSHVTTYWAVAALGAVGIAWVRDRWGQWGRGFEFAAIAISLLVVSRADAAWLKQRSNWQVRAAGNVDIGDYVRQVVAPLPERAAAWGSLYFGLDAGDRTDLVQFIQMFGPVRDDFRVDQRSKLAPDFLVLSNYEMDIDSVGGLAGADTVTEIFAKLFPGIRYRLAHLVCAPPYGVTREYERVHPQSPAEQAVLPSLSVNDGTGRQWSGALSGELDVRFSPVQPVTANLSLYATTLETAARTSIAADLPPGFYLIDVDLETVDPTRTGFILATAGRYFYWRGGWADFGMPVSPHLPGERNVLVLVDHLGGPLYLSRFENRAVDTNAAPTHSEVFLKNRAAGHNLMPPADARGIGMQVRSVRRVVMLADNTGRIAPVKLPSWSEWSIQDRGMTVQSDDSGKLRLSGTADAGVPLYESPPIPVAPHERLALTLPSEPASGGIELGVIGSTGTWLSTQTLMPRRAVFDTEDATWVRIVIANSSLGRLKAIDVTIRPGRMVPTAPQEQYVDRLMGCRSPYIHLPGLDCSKK